MNTNGMETSSVFLKILKEDGGLYQRNLSLQHKVMIKDHTTIDGKSLGFNSLSIRRMNFTQGLTITNFEGKGNIILQNLDCLKGLHIENCRCNFLGIVDTSVGYIDFFASKFAGAALSGLNVGDLNLSSLELTEKLILKESEFHELSLITHDAERPIKTPLVKTDNQLAATMFRMAGIPVFIDMEMAKKIANVDNLPASYILDR